MSSAIRIAVLYPEMLGTYGDGGNAIALTFRARARGHGCTVLQVPADAPIPRECDLYLLGGSEDGPQEYVAERLAHGDALARAVDRGAGVLAVCSGMQLLGEQFPGRADRPAPGLGLLPCRTSPPASTAARAVGHVQAQPCDGILPRDEGTGAPAPDLLGFENHRGRTTLLPGAAPLARLVRGHGNDPDLPAGQRVDGVLHGRVLGTYLHGPVLALNPALADLLLGWVLGWPPGAAPPLDDPAHEEQVEQVRRRHLDAARDAGPISRRPPGSADRAARAGRRG